MTILRGIAGAVVAGLLGQLARFYGPADGAGLIMSVIGAVLLLFAHRRLRLA